MATVYTYKSLAQRIKRHIANGFPNSSFPVSDNELYLYIDQSAAFTLVGQVYNNAKVEGNLSVPEGYLTTFQLPALQQDSVTREWFTTLPQPPVSLPLGYSIDLGYFASAANGNGVNISFIKQKRVAYRDNMPSSPKPRAWFEGSKMIIKVPDGSSLLNQTVYVRMASARMQSETGEMVIPPDAVESVFKLVTEKLIIRMQLPKDVVADDLPAGKTNVPQ